MTTNTLTGLLPDAYAALDVVSRELVGMIPAVTMDASVNRAAKDQNVTVPIVPEANASKDTTPAMAFPAEADQVIGNTKIVISKSKARPFSWQGNEQEHLNQGPGYLPLRANQMLQAMRALTNEVEADLTGLHTTFSRAYGTAGTTPFGTAGDYTDASNAVKILKDNGSPIQDNHLIIDTAAGANIIGKQAEANREGSDSILRQGVLLDKSGMSLRESAQIATAGTNVITGTVTVTGVNAVGATTINLTTAAGAAVSGVAGDIVTFAGDTEKYVLAAAATIGASATGDIVIAEPGLRSATAGSEAVSGVAAASRNLCFNRSAIVLATRMPERPEEGDMALDVASITDPRSGLTFELAMYAGYRKVVYEVALAWGVKNIKPAHTALLLG